MARQTHPADEMTFEEASLWFLRSIDESMKQLVTAANRRAKASIGDGGDVASDRDLDDRYGDPIIKFLPRNWTGDQRFKGKHMSEMPPDLLDMVAETFDYFAKKAEESNEMTDKGKPVAPYKRMDAARARGWAKRLRSGWSPTARQERVNDAAERYRQQVEDSDEEAV